MVLAAAAVMRLGQGCLCARYHARGRPEQAWAPAGLVLRAVEAEVEVQPEG